MFLHVASLVAVLALSSLNHNANAWRNFDVQFVNISCISFSDKIQAFNCSLGHNAKNVSTFSVNFTTNVDYKTADVAVKAFLINNGTRVSLMNTRFNVCQFLGGGGKGIFLTMVRKQLKSFSNYMEGCPFKKGKGYYIKDYSVDAEILPGIMPHFILGAKLNYLDDGMIIASFEAISTIVPKPKSRNGKKRH